MKYLLLIFTFTFAGFFIIQAQDANKPQSVSADSLSLITETPEEGFQLAVRLARKGITVTQPNKEVLFMLRDVYSKDPDALIASSQVIAIHFQTVAAANDYWKNTGERQ